jgi:nitroreductase
MQLLEAIFERRSIRQFKQKAVDDSVICEILKAGQAAPSRGNSQPWHFVVVKDPDKKAQLAEACYGQKLIKDAAFCIVVLGVIDPRETVPDRTAELVEADAFGQDVKDFADHILDDWPLHEMKVDAALNSAIPGAIMSLAAMDFDLGSCWVKLAKDDEVISVLGAPEGYYHTATLAFGYPDQSPSMRPRLPLSDIVSLDEYGESYPAVE